MQSTNLKERSLFLLFSLVLVCSFSMTAQIGGWNPEFENEVKDALKEMKADNPSINDYLSKSYAYVIFPKVTKAGLGVGGAAGNGLVFKGGEITGKSELIQASIGLQAGGQQYSEIIFFENESAYNNFINGKLKFDGQASAVALEKGISYDVQFKDGVAVFLKSIGGLMVEASVGGQHFKFEPIE